jgi:hypothetical protein
MLTPHPPSAPGPNPDSTSQPYWDACDRCELTFQRCGNCGAAQFQPASICRTCTSNRLSWEKSSGRGSVYSWSVVWRPPTPDYTTPFVVAIVDLEEGYQMMANVIGCEPEQLRVGLPVQVEFHPLAGGHLLPYFAPDRFRVKSDTLLEATP